MQPESIQNLCCRAIRRYLGVPVIYLVATSCVAQENSRLESRLPETVTFNAHIRPIMSNTCFVCHGPDNKTNDSGFQVDSFEAVTAAVPSDDELLGIKPGDPAGSEVYLRIIDESDGEQMPPEDFRHQLTDYDKDLFRKWIEQGAVYQEHWAYSPLVPPAVPATQKYAGEIANAVDAFILARLEKEGIEPAPLADKVTLLRRLSLDLTGLPPTLDDIASFEADDSENAWEHQVERLLASKHFGERMASSWLDLVRFADTVGFHGDQNQRIFPYRDYVIDSFNSNKPFDQFTREQLAGDLLPDPSDEQLIATGFLRLNMMTREGGAQPGEYLAKYKADRVRALGTAWLGSTLGCCECHNHKYDPFTAKDFYSLGAFFDDLQQWGVYSSYQYTPNPDLRGFNNEYPFPPELRVESQSLLTEIRALQRERDQRLERELDAKLVSTDEYREWVADLKELLKIYPDGWMPAEVVDAETSHKTNHTVLEDQSLLLTGTGDPSETITITTRVPQSILANSIRLEVLPDQANGGFVGRGDHGRFSTSLSATLDSDPEKHRSPEKVPNEPRFVRIELDGENRILSLAEVQIFGKDDAGQLTNIATRGNATQSSSHSDLDASLAIDGNTEGDLNKSKSTSHTSTSSNPWWEVDLGSPTAVSKIVIWNRIDGKLETRLDGFRIVLLNENRQQLFHVSPETPDPSLEIDLPAEVELQSTQPISIAWIEADRQSPTSYINGRDPLKISDIWRSGPVRWQLPDDESTLPHTAVFHFAAPMRIMPGQHLTIRLKSRDLGRVRISLTPIGHAIAGRPAADKSISAGLVSAFHRSTVPFEKQHAVSKVYRQRILRLHSGLAMTLVAQSVSAEQIPVSRVLPRGNWQDESGELAPPAFPHFLPQSDEQRRLTRLDLANWVVSENNPLTARHFVNRTWKEFFGSGLSGKLDDLGNQGEWPSHPQLLDWMATGFVSSGWDTKQLVRTIVNSRTYRQAAAVRTDLQEGDPYNRLLSQQSPRRLSAEMIRDNALAISGLLAADFVGGRSVFPWQPAGHYSNLQFPNRTYVADRDWRQYRRAVYMHWQRTFLHPMLVNFDAPSRDECSADRPMSNSPQQALTLLNDPTFVEASIAMANRLLTKHPDASENELVDLAFQLAVARKATPAEQQALANLLDRQRKYFNDNIADARYLLSTGMPWIQQPSPQVDLPRHAAWTQVCRVILNLHETITRY